MGTHLHEEGDMKLEEGGGRERRKIERREEMGQKGEEEVGI